MVLAAIATGCAKEESLTPTEVKNWYEIEDPGTGADAVDRKIYEIWQEYGVPVFYSDTIGSEDRGRVDTNGKKAYYYEVLDLNYDMTLRETTDQTVLVQWTRIEWWNPEEKVRILPLLELLDTKLLPFIGSAHPTCIIVTDQLSIDGGDYYAYRGGVNYVALQAGYYDAEDPEVVRAYCVDFAAQLLIANFGKKENMQKYWEIPERLLAPYLSTGQTMWSSWVHQTQFPGITPQDLGFLGFHPYWDGYLPFQEEDIALYINAIIEMSDAEFEAQYGAYPYVMERFRLLKATILEAGLDLSALRGGN